MLIKDFKKRIQNIDNHLYVEKNGLPAKINVNYSFVEAEPSPIIIIGTNGNLYTCPSFELISNKSKRKLLIASIDMAMTPLHKRVEHKWNVVIGIDNWGLDEIICWEKKGFGYQIYRENLDSLKSGYTIFTDDEFNDLIKYIKTLPDGDWQAKVAEHGKREAKGEIK